MSVDVCIALYMHIYVHIYVCVMWFVSIKESILMHVHKLPWHAETPHMFQISVLWIEIMVVSTLTSWRDWMEKFPWVLSTEPGVVGTHQGVQITSTLVHFIFTAGGILVQKHKPGSTQSFIHLFATCKAPPEVLLHIIQKCSIVPCGKWTLN